MARMIQIPEVQFPMSELKNLFEQMNYGHSEVCFCWESIRETRLSDLEELMYKIMKTQDLAIRVEEMMHKSMKLAEEFLQATQYEKCDDMMRTLHDCIEKWHGYIRFIQEEYGQVCKIRDSICSVPSLDGWAPPREITLPEKDILDFLERWEDRKGEIDFLLNQYLETIGILEMERLRYEEMLREFLENTDLK